jgi:hypothetical protein
MVERRIVKKDVRHVHTFTNDDVRYQSDKNNKNAHAYGKKRRRALLIDDEQT